MATIYDVDKTALILKAADELKRVSEIKAPAWAVYAKTGMHKQRPPTNPEWWFVRAAAILVKVQKLGPVGVSKLRAKYGGSKNRGHKPDKFFKGSGSIIRKILQQLEKAGLVQQIDKKSDAVKKGRIITGKGMKLLNRAAVSIAGIGAQQKKERKEPVEHKAEKHAEQKAPQEKHTEHKTDKHAENKAAQ